MTEKNYGMITDPAKLGEFVDRLIGDNKPIGFDIETGYEGAEDMPGASLHPEEGMVVGVSFTNSRDWARYVPVAHDFASNMDSLDAARAFWKMLRTGLGVAHNAKFELRFLSRWFLDLLGDDAEFGAEVSASRGYFPVFSDTMIEGYIEGTEPSLGLKALSKSLFDHDQATFASMFPGLAKNKAKALRFNVLELNPATVAYACEDAAWCLALHEHFYPVVKDQYLYKVEMQIITILCRMEDFGVKYDWVAMGRANELALRFIEKLNLEIQADLSVLTGRPMQVNLGSPKQLSDCLYEELGLKTHVKSKVTGQMSTNSMALAGLAKEYPIVAKISIWREMKKLSGTYLAKYANTYTYAADGMTHPSHLQTAVGTGRFAVSDPPYQQTPKKYHYELDSGDSYTLNFRDLITAPIDHYILGFDYSQIELRVMAGEAQEPSLLASFANDEDVHTATASLMLSVPKDQVNSDQRAIGKTMNFALLYGMSAKSLAERLLISKAEGQELYDQYFEAYSAIAIWKEKVEAEGKLRGYSTTKFGRKFTIRELQSTDAWIYSKGERLCVNAPIQGGAADYMKTAMVRADKAVRDAGLSDRVHLVMNIHDALEYYVHDSLDPQTVIKVLRPAVEFPVSGFPKIVADWHTGLKWGSLTELDVAADGSLSDKSGEKLQQVSVPEPTDQPTAIVKPTDQPTEPTDQPTEPPEPPEPGQRILVEILAMPDSHQYRRWLDLVASRQGSNTVILRTPQGDLEHDYESGLSPADQAEISLVLDGAVVTVEESSVDFSSLAAGLT
jgi:DNA polymerase-1